MNMVKDILSRKGTNAISVVTGTSVLDALRLMADKNIGSIMVMQGGTYLGLMTERDYARKIILLDKNSEETKVSAIMTTDLPRVNPRDTVEHCMKLMADNNVRYLPVFESGVLVGLVSIIDVIQGMVKVQRETINDLQDFISSNYG